MESRLADLLRAVVEEYVKTAQPVGSQVLVDRRQLDVSSATIRNWFAELEEAGLITQPHTSGGRIPTEHGFRAYVESFVRPRPPTKRERASLAQAVQVEEEERRLKNTAKALAELSGLAAFMGWRRADTYYTGLAQLFAQPEFKDWQRVIGLSEVLDHLDEALTVLRRTSYHEPLIILGRECPFGPACSVVIVSVGSTLIGLFGPMRMDYQQALSLMTQARQLLSENTTL
ncbi:MAG: hypothetical protein WCV84_03485 [Patescibacteria group bacterium]